MAKLRDRLPRMPKAGGGHLINPNAFSDSHAVTQSAPPPQATGQTDNYGANDAMPLAKGDPKYIQVGKKRNIAQGLTNQRFQFN